MWMDFECDSFDGLAEFNPRSEFAVWFERFQGIWDRSYDVIDSDNQNFTKNVSGSVYTYYLWQHLYARIVATKRNDSCEILCEGEFLDYIQCHSVWRSIEVVITN
jgi:hypothetical protein